MGRLSDQILRCMVGACDDTCKYYRDNACENNELMKEVEEKLKLWQHYEELEEAGRLIELPCAVGDTVWIISGTEWKGYDWKWKSYENAYPSEVKFKLSMLDGMGIDYFATEEEAEAKIENRKRHGIAAKLKELEGVKE